MPAASAPRAEPETQRAGTLRAGGPLFTLGWMVALAMAALAPLAIFATYAAVEAHRNSRAEAAALTVEVSRSIAGALDVELQSRNTAAALLGSMPAFDRFPEIGEADLQPLFHRVQEYAAALGGAQIGVWRLEAAGPVRVISTLRPFVLTHEPARVPEAADVIRRAAAERQAALGAAFLSPYTGKRGMLLARPVERGGRVVAAVTISITTAQLQAVLAEQQLPPHAIAAVVDGENIVIARVPERHIGRQLGPDQWSSARTGGFRTVSLDGDPVLAAFTPLGPGGSYKVTVAAPLAVVEAEWLKTRALLIGGGVAALIAGLALALGGRAWWSTQQLADRQAAWLNIALDRTGLATWESELSAGRSLWSPRLFALLGYRPTPDGSATRAMWWAVIHPDDVAGVRAALARADADAGGLHRLTYRILRQDDGELRWCETIGCRVDGERMVGVTLDVTEAKRDEERRILLAREVDHRSKNLLAVVQAMVRMTRAEDVASLRQALTVRIVSLGKTHSLLAQNGWRGSSLREVAESELRSYGEAVQLAGPPVGLPPEAVQPLAMALHELATNAAKHGALSVPGGQVQLAWSRTSQLLTVDWVELGGPPVAEPTTRGFGSRVITRALGQVGGTVRLDWRRAGLVAVITLPLGRGARRPAERAAAPA
jgi:two-component sensor histidine kinase